MDHQSYRKTILFLCFTSIVDVILQYSYYYASKGRTCCLLSPNLLDLGCSIRRDKITPFFIIVCNFIKQFHLNRIIKMQCFSGSHLKQLSKQSCYADAISEYYVIPVFQLRCHCVDFATALRLRTFIGRVRQEEIFPRNSTFFQNTTEKLICTSHSTLLC